MSGIIFREATKEQARLRMAITGPTGSGKTFTALQLATHLGKKVALIDTEHHSASKYGSGKPFKFFEVSFKHFHPDLFIEAIHAAEEQGFDVLVIDSLSHAWVGAGGVLDQADAAAKRNPRGNSFTAWKEATPMQRRLMDAIIQSPLHIICTMRSKMEYVLESVEKAGRTIQQPKRVGMAPVQRDDVAYEFDVLGEMDQEHVLVVTKTRCPDIDNAVIKKPGAKLAETLREWLSDGVVITKDLQEVRRADLAAQVHVEEDAVAEHAREEQIISPVDVASEVLAAEAVPQANTKTGGFWDAKVAASLRRAREIVSKEIGTPVTEDTTREWLNRTYGLTSHKQATEEQVEALKSWLRLCLREKRIV